MRKIIIYIASSLNGYIARKDGNVDWLESIPNPEKTDYGYSAFYETIDTTLMGNNTYREVLGFDVPFPYPDKTNYVFTRNTELESDRNVTYISGDIISFTRTLKSKPGKEIWLIGGGSVNSALINSGLVDELILHMMPYAFGRGIPIFASDLEDTPVELLDSKVYSSGVVEFKYRFRH
jgi:dihydrofolate reductase